MVETIQYELLTCECGVEKKAYAKYCRPCYFKYAAKRTRARRFFEKKYDDRIFANFMECVERNVDLSRDRMLEPITIDSPPATRQAYREWLVRQREEDKRQLNNVINRERLFKLRQHDEGRKYLRGLSQKYAEKKRQRMRVDPLYAEQVLFSVRYRMALKRKTTLRPLGAQTGRYAPYVERLRQDPARYAVFVAKERARLDLKKRLRRENALYREQHNMAYRLQKLARKKKVEE